MKIKLQFIILFSVQYATAQSIEIKGRVESSVDVENIHVINKTAQKFTITNVLGEFTIPVRLNDTLSFSSVQHKPKIIIISSEEIGTKTIAVVLEEQVNELDKVVLGKVLTGNLASDINNFNVIKERPTPLNLNEIEKSSLRLDNLALEKQSTQDHFKYILNPDTRFYSPDIVEIAETIFKTDLSLKVKVLNNKTKVRPLFLLDIYTKEEISENFNIPIDRVDDFLLFIEEEGFKSSFLEPDNRHVLLEFLMKKSEIFNEDDSKK